MKYNRKGSAKKNPDCKKGGDMFQILHSTLLKYQSRFWIEKEFNSLSVHVDCQTACHKGEGHIKVEEIGVEKHGV